MSGYIELSYLDLLVAASLLLVNAALSIWLDLRLERQLIVAGIRMVVQLLIVGLVLKALFGINSPWLVLLAATIMAAFAGREIASRQTRKFSGWWGYGLGSVTMVLAGGLVTAFALGLQIRPQPWYDPRYAIPLFGMVLGNTMTGISLGLNTLATAVTREQAGIEAQLLLGANRYQATRPTAREALTSGFIPIINAMAATGVVSLPGMMTGQILAGVEPTEAVKYQLLVMFLIGGATGMGVLLAVLVGVWRLTDDRHRLRLDRLAARSTARH